MRAMYIILVALDGKNFKHYCTEPKTFYESWEEATAEVTKLLNTKKVNKEQLKIHTIWNIENN